MEIIFAFSSFTIFEASRIAAAIVRAFEAAERGAVGGGGRGL